MRIHKTMLVSGKVQGVSFRRFTLQKAKELRLAGRVQNLPDGRVKIEVEGPRERVAELEAWAHQGPSAAVVEGVESQEAAMQGYHDFLVEP